MVVGCLSSGWLTLAREMRLVSLSTERSGQGLVELPCAGGQGALVHTEGCTDIGRRNDLQAGRQPPVLTD